MVVWEMSDVRLKGTKSAKEMTGKDMQKRNALTGHKDTNNLPQISKKTPGPDPWNIPQTLDHSPFDFVTPVRCGFFGGGDSVLTEHGEEYASKLAEWVDKEVRGLI